MARREGSGALPMGNKRQQLFDGMLNNLIEGISMTGVQGFDREYYQTRPVDFCVDILGVKRETIEWSLHEQYAGPRTRSRRF
jgi:hypothetical protein